LGDRIFFESQCHEFRIAQRVPQAYEGREIKCLGCGSTFVAIPSEVEAGLDPASQGRSKKANIPKTGSSKPNVIDEWLCSNDKAAILGVICAASFCAIVSLFSPMAGVVLGSFLALIAGVIFMSLSHIPNDTMEERFGGATYLALIAAAAFGFILMLVSLGRFQSEEEAQEDKRNLAQEAERSERSWDAGSVGGERSRPRANWGGWNSSSNGHTWISAPDDKKWIICRGLASGSKRGHSSRYFYDAFNAFYDPSEPGTLDQSMESMSELIERAR